MDAALPEGAHVDSAALRELKRLYAEATEEAQAKDRLLAATAHELRHPLHLMRMALARHVADNAPARDALERYIARMVRLVDDLVDFVRTEQDALELHHESIDVHDFLVGMMEDYRSTFDQRRVRLVVTAPLKVRISADPHRLVQVFSNLLDNALKFTPAGGTVSVQATAEKDVVHIRVCDTGRGVPRHLLPTVLNMPTDLSGDHGFGIGLSVARRIVERHGGRMAVDSDGPDCGTVLTVTLPLPR
jgi:signal transduction histidine kinase